MRAVSYCRTCDFRLPHYCVRIDRSFCQERCRVWWYWHPGIKRPDFSPGGWGLPAHPGKGRPKTLAAALRELDAARQHSADLEAAAKAMQLVDHHLRTKLDELRALKAEVAAVAGLRDSLNRQNAELVRRCDEANAQAGRAQAETGATRTSLAQAISDLAAQRQRAEAAERLTAQRDDDLRQRHHDFAAVEKAHQETHLVAASESRSLRAETERRMAAEQRVEQLILELEALARERRAAENRHDLPLDLDRQLALLLAENREVRSHRD